MSLKVKATGPVVPRELPVSDMKCNEIVRAAEKGFTLGQYISSGRCSPSLLGGICEFIQRLVHNCVCVCFQMAIIFNQEGLKAVRPPCVIQSFINHNAVLYKVFVVGESYTVVKRPSLKNFSAGISGTSGQSEMKCWFLQPWQWTSPKKTFEKAAEINASGCYIPYYLFCSISLGREITHRLWNLYEWHSYSKYLCNSNLSLTC